MITRYSRVISILAVAGRIRWSPEARCLARQPCRQRDHRAGLAPADRAPQARVVGLYASAVPAGGRAVGRRGNPRERAERVDLRGELSRLRRERELLQKRERDASQGRSQNASEQVKAERATHLVVFEPDGAGVRDQRSRSCMPLAHPATVCGRGPVERVAAEGSRRDAGGGWHAADRTARIAWSGRLTRPDQLLLVGRDAHLAFSATFKSSSASSCIASGRPTPAFLAVDLLMSIAVGRERAGLLI